MFYLDGTGNLTFQLQGGESPLAAPGVGPGAIPELAIDGGALGGVALRDVAAETYVLSRRRSGNGDEKTQATNSPSGQGAAVLFGSAGNGPVNLDIDRTVGAMTFVAAVLTTVSTTNGSVLTLDNGAGAAALTILGTHSVATGLNLSNNDTIKVKGAGDSLSLSGVISGAGTLTVTKDSLTGAIIRVR